MVEQHAFHEGLKSTPIRDLGLTIAGTRLEPILDEFQAELQQAGIRRVKPRFYLSTEWGVPYGTTAIAIPFYLARPDLLALHVEQDGYVEGMGRWDILRYLRHEMGHAVNYAYQLYDDENWIKQFGSITQPYVEEYNPQPFSRRYVVHLPGWYAQKHPDEDWAETFAVWMTPGHDWRTEYADWPEALGKLEYCDATLRALGDRDPPVTSDELDDDVGELTSSIEQLYGAGVHAGELPRGLDGGLRTIFEEFNHREDHSTDAPRRPASQIIRRLERELMSNVFRWTGYFPERTKRLLRRLAQRADELQQVYPEDRETEIAVALTTWVAALAMSQVQHPGKGSSGG